LKTQPSQLLVVDDEQFFAGFLQEKFEERGYSVATAKDALTALAVVSQSAAPLIVLLDLMLPGASGLQFLRELSRSPRAPQTRVVLLSAHHTVQSAAASHPLVVGRMQKPVDMGELTRLVAGALRDLVTPANEA
jgi:CheY-like chemotaxis protein